MTASRQGKASAAAGDQGLKFSAAAPSGDQPTPKFGAEGLDDRYEERHEGGAKGNAGEWGGQKLGSARPNADSKCPKQAKARSWVIARTKKEANTEDRRPRAGRHRGRRAISAVGRCSVSDRPPSPAGVECATAFVVLAGPCKPAGIPMRRTADKATCGPVRRVPHWKSQTKEAADDPG